MVSQTGIRSGKTLGRCTNNARTDRTYSNRIRNSQVLSGHHVVRGQGRCGVGRLVLPIRGSAVDIWGFDSHTHEWSTFGHLGVDKDSIPCYIINIIRKRGQDEHNFRDSRNFQFNPSSRMYRWTDRTRDG